MTTKGIEIKLPTGTLKSQTKQLEIVVPPDCDVCRWQGPLAYEHQDMWLCEEHAQEHGLLW